MVDDGLPQYLGAAMIAQWCPTVEASWRILVIAPPCCLHAEQDTAVSGAPLKSGR
jgi:hypothetical protein